MSSIGLNSNLYEVSRYYLDLLNDFVVESNYSKAQSQLNINEDIVSFFKKISTHDLSDPQLIIVYSLFNYHYAQKGINTKRELDHIYSKLTQNQVDSGLISKVSELIEVLNNQCVQSYLKIKGVK